VALFHKFSTLSDTKRNMIKKTELILPSYRSVIVFSILSFYFKIFIQFSGISTATSLEGIQECKHWSIKIIHAWDFEILESSPHNNQRIELTGENSGKRRNDKIFLLPAMRQKKLKKQTST
jgi:hypothetical protein